MHFHLHRIFLPILGLIFLPALTAAEITVPDSGQLRVPMHRTLVRNVEARDYLGDVQVWDLTTDADGRLFAATGAGLSVWDGIRWSLCETPGSPILRCLAYDPAARRIYAGADNEVGYFTKDARGGYTYTCLYQNPRDEVPEIFWRIILQDGTGYFQTHERIYRCDLQSGRMEPVVQEGAVGYIHAVGDAVWFQDGTELYALGPDGIAGRASRCPTASSPSIPKTDGTSSSRRGAGFSVGTAIGRFRPTRSSTPGWLRYGFSPQTAPPTDATCWAA